MTIIDFSNEISVRSLVGLQVIKTFTKPCRCILKISCWYPKDIVLAKMTQTQRLWFREIWCYHISHIARTPIACIFISGVSLELTSHFRASQPNQSHRHYWEEEAFCKFWVDHRSPEVVVAEKSPVDDVQQDEAGRKKVECRNWIVGKFRKSDVKIWDQIWTSWAEKIRETICQLCFWLIEL